LALWIKAYDTSISTLERSNRSITPFGLPKVGLMYIVGAQRIFAEILRSHRGVVLGTLLDVFDADCRVAVLTDLCRDQDPAAQDILLEKIFTRYAAVITSAPFLETLGLTEWI
jgi:hypothetical protein